MFTIQYEAVDGTSAMQTFDGRYGRLVEHLIGFEPNVLAVYEQATPISKRVRADMLRSGTLMRATPAARRFMNLR